jgi:hypothetical protein
MGVAAGAVDARKFACAKKETIHLGLTESDHICMRGTRERAPKGSEDLLVAPVMRTITGRWPS